MEGQLSNDGALSVRDVTVRFGGITALEDVSVEVAPGEVLGVIGPNGAGKTTLFNVICGFVRPDAGAIVWRGRELRRVRTNKLAQAGIARTLQAVGLFGGLTVLENVMVGAQRFRRAGLLAGVLALPRSARDERALRERALAALGRVGCADLAERPPAALPYATQKRVALARALVAEPALLLLDEPAGGLDAGELDELRTLVEGLKGTMAVMLVEHHMDFVTSVCDRLVALDFGSVIAAGEPDDVRRDPRVLEAYLGDEAATGALPPARAAAPGAPDARGNERSATHPRRDGGALPPSAGGGD